MLSRSRAGSLLRSALSVVTLVALAACSSTTTTEPTPNPTLSLSITPTTATVAQGGSSTFDGTATLGGSFSGVVTFAVTGLPAGVTVTVGSVTASGTSATATITIDVAGSVAVGSYTGTVTASGSGLTSNATYTLNVTAVTQSSVTLGATPDPISIQRGAAGDVTVALTRTSFTGAVTLAAEGLPANVTAAFAPPAPTGTSSTLTLTVASGATAGTTSITIRGTSSLPDATTTFDLTITDPPPANSIVVDFSSCVPADTPVWVAYQDGMSSAWMVSTPVNNVYTFNNVSGSVFGFAAAFVDGSQTDISVDYFDPALIGAGTQLGCDAVATKTVNGTLAGNLGVTSLYLGDAVTFAGVDGPFAFSNVLDGPLPLVGYTSDVGSTVRRMLLRRNQNIADNGTLGTVDFTNDGFDPVAATFTVAGLSGTETATSTVMNYAMPYGGGMCAVAPTQQGILTGTTFTGYSVPASEQQTGEFHVAGALAVTADGTRQVNESFGSFGDRTVTLPSEVPFPTLSDLTGGAAYLRLQADVTIPSEYNDVVFFDYSGATANMSVFGFGGVLSGMVSMAMPDFTSLAGFDPAWGVGASETGVQVVVGGRGQVGGSAGLCTDGGQAVTASRFGAYN